MPTSVAAMPTPATTNVQRSALVADPPPADATTAGDGASERHLIRELELAAVRDAARDARHGEADRRELSSEKERGCFSVDRGGRRDDHLAHGVVGDALLQTIDGEIVRS